MVSCTSFISRPTIRLYVVAVLILVFASGCEMACADEVNAEAVTCGLTNTEFSDLNGDAASNVDAISQYRKTISAMLDARRFKQLDCLADSARSHKEKFSGGFWKLTELYDGLRRPVLHATEGDWNRHIGLLQRWSAKYPASITPRVALAYAYLNYGWDARGHGYADTVSRNGWKLLEQRVAHARGILTQASSMPRQCPEWYVVMQWVALAQGWDPGAQRALFERAVRFEPDYYVFYRMYAISILPKWGGEDGEVETFLNQAADRMGAPAGDVLYFQVAAHLLCCETDQHLKLSWPRIQRGFHALERQSGPALRNLNLMARMAVICQDIVVADQVLSRVGDRWDEAVWPNYSYFQSVKRMGQTGRNRKVQEQHTRRIGGCERPNT